MSFVTQSFAVAVPGDAEEHGIGKQCSFPVISEEPLVAVRAAVAKISTVLLLLF